MKKNCVLILLGLVFFACGNSNLKKKVFVFEDATGVVKGTQIFFEDKAIGKITDIYIDGRQVIGIGMIDKSFDQYRFLNATVESQSIFENEDFYIEFKVDHQYFNDQTDTIFIRKPYNPLEHMSRDSAIQEVIKIIDILDSAVRTEGKK